MNMNSFFPSLCAGLALFAASSTLRAEKPSAEPAQPGSTTTKHDDDERQIRQSAELFAQAYNDRDAKAIAAMFTADGEIIDEQGSVTQGREDVERMFADEFESPAKMQVAVEIDSLRFLNADTADEEGRLLLTQLDDNQISSVRYTVLHVREAAGWRVASVRNFARDEQQTAHDHLLPLEWMIGDWIDEGHDSIVTATCRWDDGGNYLLRDYSVRRAGHVVMSGTQRIGWDPLGKQLKSWTFDSEGGHAEGYWHHDGDRWILKLTGVSADGRLGTATHIYTNAARHVTKWQAVERTLGGESLDDLPEISIVRAPGSPESRSDKNQKESQ